MKQLIGLGAMAALAMASLPASALAQAQGIDTIELGHFVNLGGGAVSYTGPFSEYISWSLVTTADAYNHTVIEVNLSALLGSLGYNALSSVTVTDAGSNAYTLHSPGADIDLFTFAGLSGAEVEYLYDGPNAIHQNESPQTWAQREAAIDSFSGSQDYLHLTQVSLGQHGSIAAMLSSMTTDGEPGNDDENETGGMGVLVNDLVNGVAGGLSGGEPVTLLLSEHGTNEAFTVSLAAFNIIPGPGALSLLAAALGCVHRRRRTATARG